MVSPKPGLGVVVVVAICKRCDTTKQQQPPTANLNRQHQHQQNTGLVASCCCCKNCSLQLSWPKGSAAAPDLFRELRLAAARRRHRLRPAARAKQLLPLASCRTKSPRVLAFQTRRPKQSIIANRLESYCCQPLGQNKLPPPPPL